MFSRWQRLMMRGYGAEERIVYGTGAAVETGAIKAAARALFEDAHVRFIHLRSASNTCCQARIDRAA